MTATGGAHHIADDEGIAAVEWLRLTAGVTRGITHAIGNRIHALEMTLSSLTPGDPLTNEVVEMVGAESAACAELVRLSRLMNFAGGAEAEACRVPDAVPDAVALWEKHIESDGRAWVVRVRGEPPAVLAPPAALTQAFLLLFIAHVAPDAASNVLLTLDVRGDNGSLIAEFGSPAGSAPARESIVAAQWLLRAAFAAATQSLEGDRAVTTLRLPSLAAARKLERERAS